MFKRGRYTKKEDIIMQKICYEFIRNVRWNNGIRCPYCLSKNVVSNGYRRGALRRYYCRNCNRYFTDITGTIFDGHKIKIYHLFFILTEYENLSMEELSNEIGISKDSIYKFVKKCNSNINEATMWKNSISKSH